MNGDLNKVVDKRYQKNIITIISQMDKKGMESECRKLKT